MKTKTIKLSILLKFSPNNMGSGSKLCSLVSDNQKLAKNVNWSGHRSKLLTKPNNTVKYRTEKGKKKYHLIINDLLYLFLAVLDCTSTYKLTAIRFYTVYPGEIKFKYTFWYYARGRIQSNQYTLLVY